MIDDSDDGDLERTVGVGSASSYCLSDPEVVQGLTDAAISCLDAQRANGGSNSGNTLTPAEPVVASHIADADAVAVGYRSRRGNEKVRRFAIRALAEKRGVEIRAAAARLNPALEYTPKDWRDPQMHGDAAAVTIRTRNQIMRTAKPRTFVLPERGMLICSGEDDDVLILEGGDAKLQTLGKDFDYDPEQSECVDCSKKQNT